MKVASLPSDEIDRLQALYDYEILDTDFEQEFDDLVKLASQICDMPISLVSLVEKDRQWFKAKVGLDAPETSRDVSFCAHAILDDKLFVVEDTTKDERFANNPLVLGNPNIKFYAGMPLITPGKQKIGTLCVIDDKPRQLTDNQSFAIQTLANQIIKLLEHKSRIREVEAQKKQIEELDLQKSKILSIILEDIKTPLVMLEGSTSFFSKEELGGDEFKYMFDDTGKAIRKINHLLTNVTYWIEMQLNKEKLVLGETNLHKLVNQEIRSLAKVAEDNVISTSNDIAYNSLLSTHDKTLQLVLRNMLLNAYGRSKYGKVKVFKQDTGQGLEIAVQDEGLMLTDMKSKELLEYSKNNCNSQGGVSLVLAQELAKKINGEIIAKRNDSKGMIFKLVINTYLR